jgi:hypothetical protein
MSRRRSRRSDPLPRPPVNRCRALLVIDNAPLLDAAWHTLTRARHRLDQASRQVHRHEETDEPGFQSWLMQTFPTLLSSCRQLAQDCDAKLRLVQAIEQESFFTGRPAHRIWQEWQRHGGRPPPPSDEDDEPDFDPPGFNSQQPGSHKSFPDDFDAMIDEEIDRMFDEAGLDPDDPAAAEFRASARGVLGMPPGVSPQPTPDHARDTYRRLVRALHPDCGGEWTSVRARLWEQVQAAWDARDADWLARLEAEWEVQANVLGPTSPLSRLRAALAEIDAARRDAEKRLRAYRKTEAWRFSLQPPSELLRRTLHRKLQSDEAALRGQLQELEDTLARWSRPKKSFAQRRRDTAGQVSFGF